MKLRHYLRLKNIQQKELARQTQLSESLVSKFNNYVCLPVPQDMKKICDALNCDVLDLYDKDEILFVKPKPRRKKQEMDCYRLTVTLHSMFRKYFEIENLRSLGFKSLHDCIQKLAVLPLMDMTLKKTFQEVNEKRSENKKAESDAGTSNPTNAVS